MSGRYFSRQLLHLLMTLTVLSSVFLFSAQAQETTETKQWPTCVYVASYTPGYFWQDQETHAIQKRLKDTCILHIFYMNSKPIRSPQRLQAIGKQAKAFIDQHHPDILLVSDDNAMKYVVQPYYKNSQLPVVFCGINNSGKPYGLPYTNTSGMIEKLPIDNRIFQFIENYPTEYLFNDAPSVAYLMTDTTSEQRNLKVFSKKAQKRKIKFTSFIVHSTQEWNQTYQTLMNDPQYDFIILGNNQSLANWDEQKEIHFHQQYATKISIAYLKTMHPYAFITFLKSPEEQGRWVAESAKLVLNRTYTPQTLQIVPNREFKNLYNYTLFHILPLPIQQFITHFITGEGAQ